MTVFELKQFLPNKRCDLIVNEETLPNSETLESLRVDNTTLVRMVSHDRNTAKSASTADSFFEQEPPRIFGPRKKALSKPERPNHESISSVNDESFGINLKAYAVPDMQLEKSCAVNCKKPLH
jgi:hypothetical protein